MSLTARRTVVGVVGAAAACAPLFFAAIPSAIAAPPQNCTAADLAGVNSGVSAATSAYLFTHPAVNDFFTTLHGLSPEAIQPKVDEYFVANPQVGAELKNIRKPLQDIRLRCGDTDGDGDVDIL